MSLIKLADDGAGRRRRWLRLGVAAIGIASLSVMFGSTLPTAPGSDAASKTDSARPIERVDTIASETQLLTDRPRGAPNIMVPGDGGPIRVDLPDGPLWIRQNDDCPSANPYPRCLLCHCEIESATQNMFDQQLDCTLCHGGDPSATTIEGAHVHSTGKVTYNQTVPPLDQDLEYQQFVNPSNLRVVRDTCGNCHPLQTHEIFKSMMATAAGHYAGGLYQNDVVDTKTPIYGTFAVTDDDGEVPVDRGAVPSLIDLLIYSGGDPEEVSTHFAAVPSQACARCHLWSRGKGYRGAEGVDGLYRADGCVACHMLYDNDGLSQSRDPMINHTEKGHPRRHVVTKEIPTEQCIHCHHRGARIGLNFTGRAQMPPRLPSGPGVPGTTDERFNTNYHYSLPDTNPEDIHGQLGLNCIDCHVQSEVMGDGNLWGHMDQATKIECRTCHGTPDETPTLTDNDGLPLPNVEENPKGEVILTSKVTGQQHPVPLASDVIAGNPRAACAMNSNHIRADGGLECYACHSSWVPNCYGCHFERDERQFGLNFMTGELERGKVSTNNKVFETLRRFTLGPNAEGRIAPYIVACQPIADVTAPDGEKILDFVMPGTVNERSGLAHNPVNPHTVRGVGEVRTCAECHRSPPTLGFGSGQYAAARRHLYTAGDSGVAIYDRDANPGQPVPDGSLAGIKTAKAIAVLPNLVQGTADFIYVARGTDGVAVFDRRPGAPTEPVATLDDVNAIDVSRVARYLYVVDLGVGVHIYDDEDPGALWYVTTIPIPTATRVVPWGIHLFVAAGTQGLVVVDIADHSAPEVVAMVAGMNARDVQLYSHYQAGSDFAVRAYVADPGFGVHIVDLLPNYDAPRRVGGLELAGAVSLDAYTRYVVATETEPSREHDYLYVAAGAAGLHVYDITDPDAVVNVAALGELGGLVVDVDVASELAPPGTDDYAILANSSAGLQVVDVNDPRQPVVLGTVPGSVGADRVLVDVQQLDRFLDEQGNELKENSHPFIEIMTRADIVRILSASIACVRPDVNGDGVVDFADILLVIAEWGPCDPPPAACPGDADGDGTVGFSDILLVLANWG